MSTHTSPCAADLGVATRLAIAAGGIALRHHGSNMVVDLKAGDEPVTKADRECSEFIVDSMKREFPNDIIISEEADDDPRRLTANRVWYIDPIDGTKAFIQGGTGYCVMIGLALAHRPILGVLYQPNHGTLLYATSGHGAWCESKGVRTRLRCSQHTQPGSARIPPQPVASPERAVVRQLMGIPETTPLRSIGLKLASMALGVCEFYVNPATNCSSWDVCAPEILLAEAGGLISDIGGRPLRYDNPATMHLQNGLIASNGLMHEALTERAALLYPALTPAPEDR